MQRINIIQALTQATRVEVLNEAGTDYINHVFYIVINYSDKIKVYKTVTEIPLQTTKYIFCTLNYLKRSYGVFSLVRVFSILNREGHIIDKISHSKWSLIKLSELTSTSLDKSSKSM